MNRFPKPWLSGLSSQVENDGPPRVSIFCWKNFQDIGVFSQFEWFLRFNSKKRFKQLFDKKRLNTFKLNFQKWKEFTLFFISHDCWRSSWFFHFPTAIYLLTKISLHKNEFNKVWFIPQFLGTLEDIEENFIFCRWVQIKITSSKNAFL